MKIAAFALFCMLILPFALDAQKGCYEKIREDGLRLIRQKKYGEAINQFWTALATCPDIPKNHDLDQLIQSAQGNWVEELQATADREKQAAAAERFARQQAEMAEQTAKTSQQLAEQKEREARAEGRRAEALRLSLLAENLRQKGQKSDALWAAFLSRWLAGASASDTLPALRRVFAEAVRDSFSEIFFETPAPLQTMYCFPNGKKILLQLQDSSIFLADAGNRSSTRLQTGKINPAGWVVSAAGNLLLTWNTDGSAKLWDSNGKPLATLDGHSEPIRAAAFSIDEKWVVTGGRDHTARLWHTANGQPAATFAGHTGNIYEICMAPDNRWMLTRSSDGSAIIWDLNGQITGVLGKGGVYLHDCAVSPEGKIVLGTATGEVRICEAAGATITVGPADNTVKPVKSVAFFPGSPDKLLARYADGTVRIINSGDRSSLILPHPLPVFGTTKSASGDRFLTWTTSPNDPSPIRIWNEHGRLEQAIPMLRKSPVRHVNWSPGGEQLLATLGDGAVMLMDVKGNILTEWPGHSTACCHALSAQFSPDGKYIITAGQSGITASRSPEPERLFKEMLEKFDPDGAHMREMKMKFDVRY